MSEKISIITICYNIKDEIERTCKSIVDQTFQDFEWIVVDGGSTDGTIDILNKYKDRIDIFISEPDTGIYNAMNKGIKRASGKWLNFMNGGDTFYDNEVLEKVFKDKDYDADVLYGNVLRHRVDDTTYFESFPTEFEKNYLYRGRINHQASFIQKKSFNTFGLYNESFKIVSDWEKVIIFKENNCRFKYINNTIAHFYENGVGCMLTKSHLKEREIIYNKYFTKISVIIPVYNTEKYLRECLDSVINQTLKEIEIICVDDGSTDGSLAILQEYAKKDERVKILTQNNKGSASARNLGIKNAQGLYIGFVDSDDWISDNYFQELFKVAKGKDCDISATSSGILSYTNKQSHKKLGLSNKLIRSKEDKEKIIVTTGVSWNKIYKKSFLLENAINCLEVKSPAEDNYFTDLAVIFSNKIAVTKKATYFYRMRDDSQTKSKTDDSVIDGFYNVYHSIRQFIKASSLSENDKDTWLEIINKRIKHDFITFCSNIHKDCMDKFIEKFHYKFPELSTKTIISLTSFPARINSVSKTIESLLNQTIKADRIVLYKVILYLGIDKFPNKEKDLPKNLLSLVGNKFDIHWTEKDLRSYTKLIPALKEYPNDVIVTADDDIIYQRDWLEKLLISYTKNPEYIHCHRAHYVSFDKEHNLLPYNSWDYGITNVPPSFNNFFTGVGGVLYPPHCLHKDVLEQSTFQNLCPTADDIWFWAMAVRNNTKIKIIENAKTKLNFVPGTQDGECLYKTNCQGEQNDIQMTKILEYYPEILDKLDKTSIIGRKNNSNYEIKIKLLGFIPLCTFKQKGRRTVYKLFGLPIWKIRKMENFTTKYYFCSLPVFKKNIKHGKTTYYFCGIPVIKVNGK